MSSLADIVPPGVVTGDNLLKLFEYARKNNFAIPAFNCTRYVCMHVCIHVGSLVGNCASSLRHTSTAVIPRFLFVYAAGGVSNGKAFVSFYIYRMERNDCLSTIQFCLKQVTHGRCCSVLLRHANANTRVGKPCWLDLQRFFVSSRFFLLFGV